MSARLSDAELQAAVAGETDATAQHVINELQQRTTTQPRTVIRMLPDVAKVFLDEVARLRRVAARLGAEVLEYRRNVAAAEARPPSRIQTCMNCRFFDAVKTPEGHIEADYQAIVKDAGACRFGPPAMLTRGVGTAQTIASSYPPVHPSSWCGRWEKLDNRKVPFE